MLAQGTLLWDKCANFPKRALPCPPAVLLHCVFANSWLFSPPHARALYLLTALVTDQSTLSLSNDVLKSKMLSLKSIQAAGQRAPLISNLPTQLPALLITADSQLLGTSQSTGHHKTGGPEARKVPITKVPIIPLQKQYICSTPLITASQYTFRSLVLQTGMFLITLVPCLPGSQLLCQVTQVWSLLFIVHISEAANAESIWIKDHWGR